MLLSPTVNSLSKSAVKQLPLLRLNSIRAAYDNHRPLAASGSDAPARGIFWSLGGHGTSLATHEGVTEQDSRAPGMGCQPGAPKSSTAVAIWYILGAGPWLADSPPLLSSLSRAASANRLGELIIP